MEKILLKTITPVHIGNGHKITSLEYVKTEGYIKILNLDRLFSLLSEEKINLITKQIEENRINFSQLNINLDEVTKYKLSFNIRNFKFKEVVEFIKTYEKERVGVYIPGSEIKGAIRTALLYKILNENWNYFRKLILQGHRIKNDKNLAKKLENKIFREPSQDFMKYLLISDTEIVDCENLQLEEVEIFNSKRKFSEYVECLKPNIELKFSVKINTKGLNKGENRYAKELLSWKRSCYEFSKDLIDWEIKYWEGRNPRMKDFYKRLKKENKEDEPLLRIGRFTGRLSHTILMLIYKKEKYFKTNLLPKTRRITSNYEPLGWIKLKKS